MTDWAPILRRYDPLKAGSIDGTDTYPHDRAVARAMGARYKPNKDVVGDPEHTVFVGRLSPHTDEEELQLLFEKYGDIKRLRLVRDIVTGFSKCYAFIEYLEDNEAYRAQKYMDKAVVDGKEIYVDFECERILKGWIPRRLGGGIGGKKEAGQLRFGGKNRPFKKPFKIDSVPKPEGETFRDRLRAAESGAFGVRDRPRDYYSSGQRDRGSDYKTYNRDRSRRRSRSRDRDRHDKDRSRSGSRSRDNERRRRSRSKDIEKRRKKRSRSREGERKRKKRSHSRDSEGRKSSKSKSRKKKKKKRSQSVESGKRRRSRSKDSEKE